jgi:hypothetical protein
MLYSLFRQGGSYLARTKTLQHPATGKPLALSDLAIGTVLTLPSIAIVIIDADAHTTEYLRQNDGTTASAITVSAASSTEVKCYECLYYC